MTSNALQRPGVYVNQALTPLAQSDLGVPGNSVAAFATAYNIGPVTPVLVESWFAFTSYFGNFSVSNGNLLHHAVYQYFANGGSACYVCRAANTDAVAAHLGLLDTNTPADTVITVTAKSPGAWGNNIYIEIVSAGVSGRFTMNVYNGGSASAYLVERYVSASVNPADTRNIAAMVNSPVTGSQYITVSVSLPSGTYVAGVNDPAMIAPTSLASGNDGTIAPVLGTVIPTAFDTLQNIMLNVNLPGVTDATTLNAILSWADTRGDVMLIIDGPAPNPPQTSAQVAANYTNMVSGSGVIAADPNAVLYGPWLLVADPASVVPGATRYVPPGGAVLALWDTAVINYGIQQPPGGTWAQVNVIDLETHFTATDLNSLTSSHVNPIKLVPGQGFCIWGVRTLGVGYPNMFVSVQRTLIQLAHDMENLMAPYVFEPNGPDVWEEVTTALTDYLTQQMQLGVLAGSTPNTAFSVVCDASNNTPQTAQAGVLNASVGVALVSPAEFIVIDLQQLTGAASSGA